MRSPTPISPPGPKRRGRRPSPKVPCDDCIARASREKHPQANLELCEVCTTRLNRPRPPPKIAKPTRVRKQSTGTPDAEVPSNLRPNVYTSLEDARLGLERIRNELTSFFMELQPDNESYDIAMSNAKKSLFFSPWLAWWEQAFSSLLEQKRDTLTLEDRKVAMILKAHHLVAEVWSDVDLSTGDLGWDVFQDKYAAIVDLATAILEGNEQTNAAAANVSQRASRDGSSTSSSTISTSLSVLCPLHEVLARCPDPMLQEKALDLLARHSAPP